VFDDAARLTSVAVFLNETGLLPHGSARPCSLEFW
jgi:hypothetical protein